MSFFFHISSAPATLRALRLVWLIALPAIPIQKLFLFYLLLPCPWFSCTLCRIATPSIFMQPKTLQLRFSLFLSHLKEVLLILVDSMILKQLQAQSYEQLSAHYRWKPKAVTASLQELSRLQDVTHVFQLAKHRFAVPFFLTQKPALPSSLGFQDNRERYLNKITQDLSPSRQHRFLIASLPSEHWNCKLHSQNYSVKPLTI